MFPAWLILTPLACFPPAPQNKLLVGMHLYPGSCWFLSSVFCQDVALASVSMRPIPFLPVLEKLSLSDVKYGSIRRFYIETLEDNAIPISLQESMINKSPPERVFRLKVADHSPFFSKPQALHKILVEISKIPWIFHVLLALRSEVFPRVLLKWPKNWRRFLACLLTCNLQAAPGLFLEWKLV